MNSTARSSHAMPSVEVSWGDLIDKLTILQIKEQRLTSPQALANVRRELAVLDRVVTGLDPRPEGLDALQGQLRSINEKLWSVEDRIRSKEAVKRFDDEFVDLARSVYRNNDERARVKRAINEPLKSGLVEEKQYTDYR